MPEKEYAACPVRMALSIFESKWNLRVLYELIVASPLRFGELKRAIPYISNTMLTTTLRELEGLNLVSREQFNEIPPHVEYSLSESGRAIVPVFEAVGEWSEKYLRPNS